MCKKDFFHRLDKVSEDPILKSCETFALTIITHGNKNGLLLAYDENFNRADVLNKFTADKCPNLKNKLKLFIFQACRGTRWDTAIHASGSIQPDHEVPSVHFGGYLEEDFLTLYSTFEGKVAKAPGPEGSPFVNNLSSVMIEEANKDENDRMHVLNLLKKVIRETASKFVVETSYKIYTQQPVMVFALSRLYYLRNKGQFPDESLEKLSAANLSLAYAKELADGRL